MAFLFEKLDVYQKALVLADEIRKACKHLPRGNYDIVDQLRRATVSISANIAEGMGRWHERDKKQFLLIARGSVFECVPLLELLTLNNALDRNICQDFKTRIDSISQMINGLIRRLDSKSDNK